MQIAYRDILAGKCGSPRHSTTSFSERVVVAETSYQILDVLEFCNRERAKYATSFNNDNSANFSGEKKYNEEFQGVYFLTIPEKTFNQISYS